MAANTVRISFINRYGDVWEERTVNGPLLQSPFGNRLMLVDANGQFHAAHECGRLEIVSADAETVEETK